MDHRLPCHPSRRLVAACLAFGGLAACDADGPPPPRSRAEAPPVARILHVVAVTPPTEATQPIGCRYPNVARGADGRVYVCWIRKLDGRGQHALEFSRYDGHGFTAARTIAAGERWFVNWADFPSLTPPADGTLAAHWLERNGGGTYAYGVRVACSRDAGETWNPPFWIHADRSPTEHGFHSIVPISDGSFHAVWLDGRDLKTRGSMTLRARRFDASGPTEAGVLLDERVCECCCTDAGISNGQMIAVYRDASEAGIRDISIVRQVGAQWTDAAPCAVDGWRHPG